MTEEKRFFYRKVVLLALFIMCVFLAILFIRQVFYQHKHSNEAAISKDIEKVKAHERVILNHFPLSPYTKKAVYGLMSLCERFAENDEKLYCYETLRSCLIQIRSFYQPYADVLEKVKPKIADLRAKEKIAWKYSNISMSDYEKIYKEQMAILNYDNSPSFFWSMVVVCSLLGWIGSVVLVIFKGLTKPINKRWISWGVLLYLFFFSLWILGLWQA